MINSEPAISIGLPVYNAEKYLEEGLNSILAQTCQDFELIISDNASTDRTQDICQEYAQRDPRIRYHRNDRNLGAAPNHNIAFQLARGKYFKWAGYDDKISTDFLSKCKEVLDNNPDVVLCMPLTSLIDAQGEYISEFPYKADADLPSARMRFQNMMLKNESGNYVYGLMRVKSVAKVSPHGSYPSSDLVFLAELAFHGRYRVIPEALFYRRIHAGQSTKGKLSVERTRVLWFDASLEGKIVLPKWQYLFGYIRAVKNAPINSYDRMVCYLQVLRWALRVPHLRAFAKDMLLAVQKLILHSFYKIRMKLD